MKIDHHAPSRGADRLSTGPGGKAAYEALLRELGEPGLSAVQVAVVVVLVVLLPVIAGLWR